MFHRIDSRWNQHRMSGLRSETFDRPFLRDVDIENDFTLNPSLPCQRRVSRHNLRNEETLSDFRGQTYPV